MKRFGVCLAVLALGAPLSAQTVAVQTGEHPTFSRVVLTIPQGAEWRIERIEGGYGVVVDGVQSFDLNNFFNLIPRDRISDVSVEENGLLALKVPCDCAPNAFMDGNRHLVIDIVDGPSGQTVSLGDTPSEPEIVSPNTDRVFMPLDMALIPDARNVPRPTTIAEVPAPEVFEELAKERSRLSGLEVAVGESLARAASQGLLELAESPTGADITAPVASEPPADPSSEVPVQMIDPPASRRPGVVAHSSVDDGLSQLLKENGLTFDDPTCWPDELTDVVSWADDSAFSAQLAMRRAALTGEFDVIDPTAVEALARLYVYFGFGREAMQSLRIDGRNSRERSAIKTLAEIIENIDVTDQSFLGQTRCDGHVAMWAVLATPPQDLSSDIDENMIAREFKLLPAELQVFLGPRMSNAFVAMKAPDTAEIILQPGIDANAAPIETAMATSNIYVDRGDLVQATQRLSDVAETQAHATPEAIVNLIDLQIRQSLPVDLETIEIAKSMLFEYRNTPEAEGLGRAVVVGHLQRQDFNAAWEAYLSTREIYETGLETSLKEDVIKGVTESAEDLLFLDISFSDDGLDLSPELLNGMASRLLDLGFPERANALLSGPAVGSTMVERRYLRAEAAVAIGDFGAAEAHLAGIDSSRARTILSFGPNGIPLSGLTDISSSETSEELSSSWRNGDWSALAASDDTLMQDVSTLILADEPSGLTEEAPLAESRALIESSAQTRQTLDALMQRFGTPPSDIKP